MLRPARAVEGRHGYCIDVPVLGIVVSTSRLAAPPVPIPPAIAIAHEPLWHLVYRYWFWGWLFLDVNSGDLLRRAAAWRHNVRQRVHLPVYMRRWLAALVVTGTVAVAIETALDARVAAALFYTGAVMCSLVQVIAGIAWAFLRER